MSMTTEQSLNQLRHLDNEVQAMVTEQTRLADQRQALIDMAETWGGSPNGVCVQHSIGSKTESIGISLANLMTDERVTEKIQQYQRRIYRKLGELLEKKYNALLVIERIPEGKYRTLLMYRYINNLKWETIADLMGYAQNWVEIDLKRKAIDAFDEAKTTM